MEYSLFMIKPCAYDKKDEILNIISKSLNIVSVTDTILSEELLEKIYRNEKDNIFRKNNIQILKNGKACIGVVSGEHAIKDLIDICGNKPLGSMCKEGTIRYMFNPEIDTTYINGEKFFINAIHRSDAEDASDDVELYYTYLKNQ